MNLKSRTGLDPADDLKIAKGMLAPSGNLFI